MEKFEIKLYNMDKPNKNGRYYSKEAIEKALQRLDTNPLFLFDSMPDTFEQNCDLRKIIGRCADIRWEDSNRILCQTFEIFDVVKFEKLVADDNFPCLFGTGEVQFDNNGIGHVQNLTIDGFGLAKSCAWNTSIKQRKE